MRGTSSGGKTKTRTKTTTPKPQPGPALVIFNEVDVSEVPEKKQFVYRFSVVNGKQLDKLPKKLNNIHYFDIIAGKQVAFRFAEKWGKAKRLEALYLVSITEVDE